MQLSTAYSNTCGLKIQRPYIYELFFPFVEEKFITIDTDTNNYNYWSDVISLILPYLNKKNISIFQLGNPQSAPLPSVNRTNGILNAGQKSFLLGKTMLHVSSNNYSSQLAASLDKKLVCLVKNEKRALPFSWGNSEYCDFIYPESKKFIEPERLAKIILEKLEIDFKFEYKTLFMGDKYKDGVTFVEMYPSTPVSLQSFNLQSILVRMDLNFSEQVLAQQLSSGKAAIYTDRKIDINILRKFSANITDLIYEVKEENDVSFCQEVKSLGIPCNLISFLSEEKINSYKLDFMEIGNILPQKSHSFSDAIGSQKVEMRDLFFKSKKYIMKDGSTYLSQESLNKNIKSTNSSDIQKVLDTDIFWKNLDALTILKKTID
jgi:hypothetical protein